MSRGQTGRVIYVVCQPLKWWCVQGACIILFFCFRHPVFVPGSSKVAVGFFGLFVSLGSRICPNCAYTHSFLVPYSFLYILLLEERCVQVETLQQRVPGLSLWDWKLF